MAAELVDATDLDRLSDRLEMRGLLPHIVRRLIAATPGVKGLDVPAEEGIAAHGFDGVIEGGIGSPWVPGGASVWEMGAGQDPARKAQEDIATRTENPLGAVPAETAFVFVTSRRFDGRTWARERTAEGIWRGVRVINAEGLYAWLEATPEVHVWLSERLGFQPLSVRTLSRAFETIAARTRPRLPGALLLAGRDDQVQTLRAALSGPASAIPVRGGSREESVAFMAAALGLDGLDADRAGDQPLQIKDPQELERLALVEHPIQFVVAIDGCEVADAVARGHHVLLALGPGDYDASGLIALPRPAPGPAREALERAGVPLEQTERIAGLARRSFAALMRELAIAPAGARPAWATGADAPLLAGLLLLGGWTRGEGDVAVLEAVAAHPRLEIEELLTLLAVSDDPPWTSSGFGWRLVSSDDAFALLSDLLRDEVLLRWREAAAEVLCEIDPRAAMDTGERMLAELRDEARPRYSRVLREGVAEAVALLGARGGEPLPTEAVPADYAVRLVTDVLARANADQSGGLWRALDDVLPMLAEGAPDAFLDAVNDGIALDPSPVVALFVEAQDDPLSTPPHTGLLWALERLAWSPEYLARVTLVLGELAEHDPERSKWSNRPTSTLRATFLAWFPNTDADLSGRLRALDALRARHPEVGWRLMLAMLPEPHSIGARSARPRYRDWGLEWEHVTSDELVATIHEVVGRILTDAAADGERWAALVPRIYSLPPADRVTLLDAIEVLDPGAIPDESRLRLWRALVNEGERHLRFPNADWSLDREDAERYLALAGRLEDRDSPERHARLFDSRVYVLGVDDDFETQQRALDERRDDAAADVFERGGVEGLTRLADASEQPRLVGIAAGSLGDEPAAELIALLGGEGSGAAMAAGWAARRVRETDTSWVAAQLESAELGADAQAALMLELPDDEQTWDLLERLGADVQARYWRAVRPLGVSDGVVQRVVESLLCAGRSWAAIDVLAASVHGGHQPDHELIERTLLEAAQSDQVDAAIHAAWEVGQLLDSMEASGAAETILARIEFAYLQLLDNVRAPRALEAVIAAEPELYVDLVRHSTSRADGADDPEARPELGAHAWQILHDAANTPGTDDGRVDPGRLHDWVADARARLAALDRAQAGDTRIGEFLARSPVGVDGVWPSEAVRELLENVRSAALDDGLRCGRMNLRGTTVRGAYDGGEQEAALAATLREESRQLEIGSPRAARVVRKMAESYEADARRLDREARRRGDA